MTPTARDARQGGCAGSGLAGRPGSGRSMTDAERIAELEQALESCLDWAGELQDRNDALEASKALRLARVLGAARGPADWLRLPTRAWEVLRSPAPSVEPLATANFAEPAVSDIPRDKPVIVVITPWLSVGGAEKVVLNLVRGLAADGTFVVIAAERGRHERREEFLAATRWVYHREDGLALARLLGEIGPDGVIVSATRAGYDVLPALDGRGVWRADLLHNVAPEGSLGDSLDHDARLDLHFCVGRLQARAYADAGVAEPKIVVVPNTVDAAGRFNPAAYATEPHDGVRVGVVARLSEEKGVDLFVDAFALARRRAPGLTGVIAGDGPERIRLERRIRRLGLTGSLRILGFTSRVPEVLAELDVVVLPSRVEGASPNAAIEAMAMGRCVIAADVAGVGEAIEDGVNGRLLRERTPEAFADAIVEAAGDAEMRARLGAEARRTTLKHFQPEPVLNAYRTAIVRALPRGRAV